MRTKLSRQFILLVLLLGFFQSLYAQKDPIKFGKVTIEELKMTKYDLDTTAEAVVLCDYGVFDNQAFEFTRVCRIKIFKKDGLRFANVHVGYNG
ncbi:MAG: hypothetical protein C0597_01220, partial [Marinilabiliales bacterium]